MLWEDNLLAVETDFCTREKGDTHMLRLVEGITRQAIGLLAVVVGYLKRLRVQRLEEIDQKWTMLRKLN